MTDAVSQTPLRAGARLGKSAGPVAARWGAVTLFALAYIGVLVLIAAPRGSFLTTPEELAVSATSSLGE